MDVRGVDVELLTVIPMHGQTTAQEIFRQLCDAIVDAACKALMDVGTPFSGEKYADAIVRNCEEFDHRFADFKTHRATFQIFADPFSFVVQDVPPVLQMELIDLQCNSELKAKFREPHPDSTSSGPQDKLKNLSAEQKLQKVEELKKNLTSQQMFFTRAKSQSEAAVKASFIVAEEIAKSARSFTEGEFLKSCMMKVCDVLCPDNRQILANVSLSRNTVADRVCEMATDLRTQLMERSKDIIAYCLAVDESTDMTDTAQLAIFIRGVDSSLCVTEEILDIKSMHGTTTEKYIFEKVCQSVTDMKLPWNKLIGLTTDGAPAMCSEKSGLVGRMRVKMQEENCTGELKVYHCIIHKETLCGKVLKMEHLMSTVTQTVNFIDVETAPVQIQMELIELQCNETLKAKYDTVLLVHSDFNKPFLLSVDASSNGLGAVLLQVPEGGNKARLVTFANNNPLTYILSKPKLDACEQRWVTKWALFEIDIKYIPGPRNVVVDALSRQPFVKPSSLHRLTRVP
ncbi:protein FAM200A-like [Conger conger]|uniref:protein FAM200A-like n=1 Tax=Conger conger TaxID=82655 RepID=UPI002A598BDC|nr:protein FAM200A-like [Conger conger]